MRHFIDLALALALLASSLRANAQDVERGKAPSTAETDSSHETGIGKSWLERVHPEAFEDPNEHQQQMDRPTLQLDESALALTPNALVLEEAQARVHRGKVGLGVSAFFFAAGIGTIVGTVVATSDGGLETIGAVGVGTAFGGLMCIGGLIGMGISGGHLYTAQQELRTLQEARGSKGRRARWDLARSRLVF